MKAIVAAGFAGLLFAVGLGLGGMTNPANVVGFLDFSGDWNPSLAFVMGGALLTHATLRLVILRRRRRPVLAPAFPKPGRNRIDPRLIAGAGLFGIGWGLSGYCPGPALTTVGTGGVTLALFVVAMAAGMLLFHRWECWLEQRRELAAEIAESGPGAGL